ncbi:MAG: DUF3108 domain-containing protein [candidate division Zixibacteria bacterium]|jgi:hypothetical protein|nr:DUF3108 domain-containing protein [candidate division Zixibacteria bacterium]
MKRKIYLITAFLSAVIATGYLLHLALSPASAQSTKPATPDDPGLDRYIENVAFGPGEKLTFDIGYGFINAGSAIMEVGDLIEYNGRPCYLTISTANSNKFFSSFYRVEDKVTSIVDAVGLYSWRFEKKLSEGSYRAELSYTFDQAAHKAFFGKDTVDVAPFVQDALSVLYFVRAQELKVGKSLFIDNFTDGKKYPMEVKVHRKETIKVKAGKFDCIVVEPLLLTSGIFKHEGKLTVWLTDDRLKLPVLMKSKVLVGSISAELTEYKLGEILDF